MIIELSFDRPNETWQNALRAEAVSENHFDWGMVRFIDLHSGSHLLMPRTLAADKKNQEPWAGLERLVKEADEFWSRGDSANGIPRYENLLGQMEVAFGKDSPMAGLVLFRLGFLHALARNFEKALPYLERSRKLVAPLPDTEPNIVTKANLQWSLGLSYKSLLRSKEAIQAFEQSLRFKEKLLGVDSTNLVEILFDIADMHSQQHRTSAAIPLLERALAISEKAFGKESIETAEVLARLGNTRKGAGQFELALACLTRCLGIREKLLAPTDPAVGIAFHNLGTLHLDRGDCAKASPLLERGAKLLEKSYGSSDVLAAFYYGGALNGLGKAQIECGFYEKGVLTLQQSLTVMEATFGSSSINLVDPLNALAVAYNNQGEIDRARRFYERAIRILEIAPPHVDRDAVLINYARMLLDSGDDATAFKLFTQSLESAEAKFGANDSAVAWSLNDLALIYERRGEAAKALTLLQRSLAILESNFGATNAYVADVLNGISVLMETSGDTNRALSTLQRALAIQEKVLPDVHPAIATSVHNLGAKLLARGDSAGGLASLRKSIAIRDAVFGKNNPQTCTSLEELAGFEIGNGEWAKGLESFVEAARRRRRYLAVQLTFARSTSALGIEEARSTSDGFHSAFGLARGWLSRSAAAAGAEQLVLGKALLEEVEASAARLAADGHPRVLELLEQSAAIERQLEAIIRRNDDRTWLRETTAWQNSARNGLEQELGRVEGNLSLINDWVAKVVREQDLSLADIARRLPRGSVLADFVQYRRIESVKGRVEWKEPNCAVYLTFPLAMASTNLVVQRVDLGEAEPINEAVEQIGRLMASGQIAPKRLQPVLQGLSDLVYAPLAKHLTNVSHLIVCPDGQLSRVPFEMLLHEGKYLVETKTISYVTSGREIVRLASSQASPKSEESKVQRPKSLVMGDPDFDLDLGSARASRGVADVSSSTNGAADNGRRSLTNDLAAAASTIHPDRFLSRSARGLKFSRLPSAATEARSVANLLGKDAELRIGKEAREAELKTVVAPRVLHLATHGFFLSDQEIKSTNAPPGLLMAGTPVNLAAPWPRNNGTRWNASLSGNEWENPLVRCGIALAGANHALQITNAVAEDGLLTGLEASLLNLQGTELVVLSACDSGTGEIKIGEGVMSLRRAFRIAGAETVLASHWKVSDKATSQLMTEFMRRWRSGQPRAEAWREAQLTLLRSEEFSNPYFWAAFTLTGQWR